MPAVSVIVLLADAQFVDVQLTVSAAGLVLSACTVVNVAELTLAAGFTGAEQSVNVVVVGLWAQ